MRIFIIISTLCTIFFSALFGYTNLTASQVHDRLVAGDTLLILDVREWSEYYSGHIAEPDGYLPLTPAIMPWSSGVLSAEYSRLPEDIDIIVHCASGGRSASASSFLEGQGFTRIFNMTGGFSSWSYESRTGGFGDHSGVWIHPTDTLPMIAKCPSSMDDTSSIVFYPSALPGTDSIYIELHRASFSFPIPPNVPVSDLAGLFRVTALDKYGLPLFTADSFPLDDTVSVFLVPEYPITSWRKSPFSGENLTVHIPDTFWLAQPFDFLYPTFHRSENVLRRWYNAAGFGYLDVCENSKPNDAFLKVFPNPFNSSCAITISTPSVSPPYQGGDVPDLSGTEGVNIEIYDLRGNVVATPSLVLPLNKGEMSVLS